MFGPSLLVAALIASATTRQAAVEPDTIVVRHGHVELRALLWRPPGRGPFPAILFNHGSGTTLERQSAQAAALGQVFAGHGYVFMYLFRRGSGLSASQGTSATESLARALASHGQDARNALQICLLENDHLNDATAALKVLRSLPGVDPRRVAVAGHSFGGSLSLIMSERDTSLRAVISFAVAAESWDRSPELRARLLTAVRSVESPVFFVQAANDYSVASAASLSGELKRLGKRYRTRTYPAVGTTRAEGHDLFVLRIVAWERDVFAFLDQLIKR